MGDIFDRSVHPLYMVMAFASALVVLLMLISKISNRNGLARNHKLIFLWSIFFEIQDGIWGLFAAHIFHNDTALFCVSNVFHFSAMFSAFAWALYFLSRIKEKIVHSRVYIAIAAVIAMVQLGMITANLFSHFMFYVDAEGWYRTTDERAILFYLQFATYILIGAVSLIGSLRKQGKHHDSLLAVFCVNLSPLLFSVFQLIYPDAPADSIGFAIACIIIGLFLSRDSVEYIYELEQMQTQLTENLNEISRKNDIIENYARKFKDNAEQLSRYKRAILSDALISLEVNLSTDELYYGTWKDDAGRDVALRDILGMDVPCSYDEYINAWNDKFVNEISSPLFAGNTDRDKLLDFFNHGQAEITFDYEAKTISGRSIWLRRNICMTHNQDGDIIAFTNVKDISALMGQKKREERYILALTTEYDSIAVVDFEVSKNDDKVILHRRISANIARLIDDATANEVWFSRKLELLARFVHPEDRERFHAATRRERILESFAAGSSHIVDFRIMKPDAEDSFLYYQFRFVPLRNDDGKPLGMIAGLRDVDSEVRQDADTRRQLEKAKIAAEAASQAKSTFLFNMSHDIRTPMNAIIGFTDIAEKHIDDQKRVRESLAKVRNASDHLLSLINDVLDMSRVESGTVKIEPEPVCIDRVNDNLYSILNGSAEAKHIHFSITVDASVTHQWIYADRLRMMRVFTNIVSNSVKYTNPGGNIELRIEELPCATPQRARFRYTISDTGQGMSEEFLSHIFEPFARAQSATKSGVIGTGLGMAITKSLTELMGGTIEIESKPGVGTTVRLEFENAIAEPVSPTAGGTLELSINLKGKKILLVDDNELNREIATEILEEEEIIVDTADDGDVAVEKIRNAAEGQYDLVLMDIQMPRMNGYEATRQIRSLPSPYASRIPIIAMTANAFDEDKRNALDAGMNGHLAKPIDVPKLFNTLTEILQ